MLEQFIYFLLFFKISLSYKANPTPWLCLESDDQITSALPSCLPGHIIDIENVIYESTHDNTCSGITSCRIENKNTLLFACNHKRKCQIDLNQLRFQINSTCGSTIRLSTRFRCLPVIQEQTDYVCSTRRLSSNYINLSCQNNYYLTITMATIGLSSKQQDETIKSSSKCDKDTQTNCINDVTKHYQNICNQQTRRDSCQIKFNERPILENCPYSETSNFSMVQYSCVPSDGIVDDLPRIDICATNLPERLTNERGLLFSPNYSQYLLCKKELLIPRESRVRLLMIENSHEFYIKYLNNIKTLETNQLFNMNVTNQMDDDYFQFELKPNQISDGKFLLYFQIDSRLSKFAPLILEPNKIIDENGFQGKKSFLRDWRILLGTLIGLLLILIIVIIIFIVIRMNRRRRERSHRFLKSEDDYRPCLNTSRFSSENKNVRIEQPYLSSSSPTILPINTNNSNRPKSASSTTSSIIIQQVNDGISDCEKLIKPIHQITNKGDIDNFYEEIKEQQQQTALALGINNDLTNPYLEAKHFQQKTRSAQPIRDHHENEPRYQHPSSSNKSKDQSSENIAVQYPKPSAPPRYFIDK